MSNSSDTVSGSEQSRLSVGTPIGIDPAVLREINATLAGYSGQIQSVLRGVAEMWTPYIAAIQGVAKSIQPLAEHFRSAIEVIAQRSAEFQAVIEKLPELHARAFTAFAAHGWYVDGDMIPADVFERLDEFETGKGEQAHAALCDYFESRLDEVELSLCAENPRRERLLSGAFAAHRHRNFAASIPLFLAQADGVCWEITNEQLYKKKNQAPALAQVLPIDAAPPFTASLLVALVTLTPITAGTNDRHGLVGALNRHAIIHGESLDYDTRLNSCRAISLLVHVNWVLRATDVALALKKSADTVGQPAASTAKGRRTPHTGDMRAKGKARA